FFYMDSKGRETVGEWTGAGNYSIVGSDHMEGTRQDPKYYNSVFAVTYGGAVSGPYSKFHLVPFGEYVPFAKTIPFIRKVVQRYGYTGFTPGESVKPLAIGEHLVGPIVCFDSFFPEIARRQALQGAGFLAHLSYETWYGDTPASAQIFTNGVLRSAETGLYMVRCVASGISGFVDDRGRITAVTRLFTRDALARDIKIRKKGSLTPYTRYGEWFVWECLIVLLAACLIRYKIK
ncbi:MAG: apolipoprotein N-acyltransferase, partial [Spirochaetia bacterium]|nr:apolipoprotein N-acyltransferase [Spirochaetia bacterium]